MQRYRYLACRYPCDGTCASFANTFNDYNFVTDAEYVDFTVGISVYHLSSPYQLA